MSTVHEKQQSISTEERIFLRKCFFCSNNYAFLITVIGYEIIKIRDDLKWNLLIMFAEISLSEQRWNRKHHDEYIGK